MRMRFYKILFLLIISPLVLHGQSADSLGNGSVVIRYSKGFLYAHHESFKYFTKNYIPAFEINLNKRTDGTKLWHQLYHFPAVGVGYNYTDFGNPEQLGHANSFFTFISVPLIETSKLNLSYKCAGGVAWVSKKFDLYGNIYNIAIGSNLNAYLNLNLDLDVRLINKLHLHAGIGLTHFSNGGSQQPNKGFNIFSSQLGVRYQFNDIQRINRHDSIPGFVKRNEFSLIYGGGVKTLEPARTKKYFVSSLSLNAERKLSYKTMVGLGIDLFKDNSRKEYLLSEDIQNPEGKDLFYAGGHASFDLVFGKTSFTIQMGAYFWQKSKHYESVYHRFGLKYRFSEHWLANVTLKTFWAAADFAEWGIGYRF
ncbi:MAG: acyloxyacyl hydrolase [Bacteroidales bacterium]|nr:acyloxyacyl hydrolase [Bacteroidales bacterium]